LPWWCCNEPYNAKGIEAFVRNQSFL